MAFISRSRVASVLNWMMKKSKGEPGQQQNQAECEDSNIPDPDEMSCCEDEDYFVIPTPSLTPRVQVQERSQNENCSVNPPPGGTVDDLLEIIQSCEACKRQLELRSPSFVCSPCGAEVSATSSGLQMTTPIGSSTPRRMSLSPIAPTHSPSQARKSATHGKENTRPDDHASGSADQSILNEMNLLTPTNTVGETTGRIVRHESPMTPDPGHLEESSSKKPKRKRSSRHLDTPMRRSQRLKQLDSCHKN